MTRSSSPPKALVTGASSGIGATYADRLAKRGHDLLLVARDGMRLNALAERLREETGVAVDILAVDLTNRFHLERVEQHVAEDPTLRLLVNCAGLGSRGPMLSTGKADIEAMASLNITTLMFLTQAAAKAFAERGGGAIINIGSVVCLAPEKFNALYAASKAFVLALTQGLDKETRPYGIRLQAVLPGLTRTEIFERAGLDIDRLDPTMIMEAGELVDAALVGFDRGELVTIPSLPDIGDWDAFEDARRHLGPNLSRQHPATRYGIEG
ncbi:SDR family NAD(P)-dependent oxidoreductase [Rhizobium sp. BK313]|uniref:SDR family NAD(P)-dependent oxidoreductase n=1 Tax=Rhizobium sp. BK313 TaxID=2587081 RepID=UPI00105B23BD|nr:SDR family oxidoreductase [Rhizobium sp. BK313]